MNEQAGARVLFTIGHGRRELSEFLELLRQNNVTAVADVRTTPLSRWSPHFNRRALEATLQEENIKYVFLGDELGGRPTDPALYSPIPGKQDQSLVKYHALSQTENFLQGLNRLRAGLDSYTVALLCSESDYKDCHRNLLVARALLETEPDTEIIHISKTGSLDTYFYEEELVIPNDTTWDQDPWLSHIPIATPQSVNNH